MSGTATTETREVNEGPPEKGTSISRRDLFSVFRKTSEVHESQTLGQVASCALVAASISMASAAPRSVSADIDKNALLAVYRAKYHRLR